jgi:hypothetical protein
MGTKVQRKLYFLVISGKSLICVDDSTSSPVDNPSGFLGRSSIPTSANCIELKPNTPTSSDSFCPNSGVFLPEKSYVDYDGTSNTLVIKRAAADGNCGYSLSTTTVPLQSKEYTLYVRAIGVFPLIGANYDFGNPDWAPTIYPINADFYYYVFSSLNGALNWDFGELVHSLNELISPIYISGAGASRLLPYLKASRSDISLKYQIKSIPPSATVSYYQNDEEGEPGFAKSDPDVGTDSQSYIQSSYDVKFGSRYYLLFNWEGGDVYPSYPTFILWPLAYDKIVRYDLYDRAIDDSTFNLTLAQEAAQLLNQAVGVDSFPGIYHPNMYVNVEINAVQYYPLESSPSAPDGRYRRLYPDDRFDYPIQSGWSWSRTYHLIPALYRSYASTDRPGWIQAGIWSTHVRYGSPSSPSFNVIYGTNYFNQGSLWSVDTNCNLVYIKDNLLEINGTERRNITEDLLSNFRSFYSTGSNIISLKIYPGIVPDAGENAVRWVSLKYAIDIIYTVRISQNHISVGTPLTVTPPIVCPPPYFPVMLNNRPYIP